MPSPQRTQVPGRTSVSTPGNPLDFSGDFVRVSLSASLLLLLRDVFPSRGN